VLELEFALVQDKLNHDARDESQGNSSHEYKVIGTCSLLNINKLLVNWEGLVYDIERKLRVISRHSKYSLVHVLGEHSSGFLRSHIQVVDNVVEIAFLVCLVDLVGAITVRE